MEATGGVDKEQRVDIGRHVKSTRRVDIERPPHTEASRGVDVDWPPSRAKDIKRVNVERTQPCAESAKGVVEDTGGDNAASGQAPSTEIRHMCEIGNTIKR